MVCTICEEAVTNPICSECLAEQMRHWLKQRNMTSEVVEDSLKIFKGLPEISKCVLCGSNMTVCRHCFAKEVYDELKFTNPEMEEEFMRMFNYEIYEW